MQIQIDSIANDWDRHNTFNEMYFDYEILTLKKKLRNSCRNETNTQHQWQCRKNYTSLKHPFATDGRKAYKRNKCGIRIYRIEEHEEVSLKDGKLK